MLDGSPQHPLMPLSRYLVEQYRGDPDLRVESKTPEDLGCRRSGHFGRIHNEDDRCPQEFRQFRRRESAVDVDPVVKPTVAFHKGTFSLEGALDEGPEHLLRGHQKGVQVVTRLMGCHGQPACINVVRPLLERYQPQAMVFPPCRHQTQGDQGLAGTAPHCCHYQTRFLKYHGVLCSMGRRTRDSFGAPVNGHNG